MSVERTARDLGEEHGETAAEWAAQDAFGGRVGSPSQAKASAKRWLDLIDEGSSELSDLMGSPLSGEWVGGMTDSALAEYLEDEIREELDDEELDAREAWREGNNEDFNDLLSSATYEYEEGYYAGFEARFRDLAELAADDDEE